MGQDRHAVARDAAAPASPPVPRHPTIRDLPVEMRPRERLLAQGAEALGPSDLLAILLQRGSRGRSALELATELLAATDGLGGLAESAPGELVLVRGIGPARAAVVAAAVELGRRLQSRPLAPGTRFTSSREVFLHYEPRLRDLKKEVFFALLLDGKNRILRECRVSEGSLTASLVHPREVFRPAIREAAAAVLFVHNHPSGDPMPSQQDIEVTLRLKQTGNLVGIAALDHVIVGSEGFVSLAERGIL